MSEVVDNPQSAANDQNPQTPQNEANQKTSKEDGGRIAQLEADLKQRENELVTCRKRISQLEEEVSEAQKAKAQHLKETGEVETLKMQSEDTLTRAKSIIFDKTKVIKNQELQIEALNQQIQSLKDVVAITKDLLEIRNLEIKQLETKIQCMEDRVGAEKERHDLMHKKLEHMIRYNGDLKREYETQLCLFSALRERYNERELARGVVADMRGENKTTTDPAVETAPAPANEDTNTADSTNAPSTSQENGDDQPKN